MDTYVYKSFQGLEKEHSLTSFIEEISESLDKEMISNQEIVLSRIKEYYIYNNTLIHSLNINAAVHLVEANDRETKQQRVLSKLSKKEIELYKSFQDLTYGQFSNYKAKGNHDDLLKDINIRFNVNIIHSIIEKIFSSRIFIH